MSTLHVRFFSLAGIRHALLSATEGDPPGDAPLVDKPHLQDGSNFLLSFLPRRSDSGSTKLIIVSRRGKEEGPILDTSTAPRSWSAR